MMHHRWLSSQRLRAAAVFGGAGAVPGLLNLAGLTFGLAGLNWVPEGWGGSVIFLILPFFASVLSGLCFGGLIASVKSHGMAAVAGLLTIGTATLLWAVLAGIAVPLGAISPYARKYGFEDVVTFLLAVTLLAGWWMGIATLGVVAGWTTMELNRKRGV